MLAAGVTVRLDPMTTQRSAFSAWSKLVFSVSVCGGILCVCVCVCGEGRREGGGKMLAVNWKVVHLLPSGRFSPKWIIVSKSSPRQLGSSHLFTAEHTHIPLRSCMCAVLADIRTSEVAVPSNHTVVPEVLSLTTSALLHITIAMEFKQSCVCVCAYVCVHVCVCMCVHVRIAQCNNAAMR